MYKDNESYYVIQWRYVQGSVTKIWMDLQHYLELADAKADLDQKQWRFGEMRIVHRQQLVVE